VRLYDDAVAARMHALICRNIHSTPALWVGELPARKIQRRPEAVGAGPAEILGRLKAKLADLLGFDEREIDVSRPVRDYGIDSISVIQLLAHSGGRQPSCSPKTFSTTLRSRHWRPILPGPGQATELPLQRLAPKRSRPARSARNRPCKTTAAMAPAGTASRPAVLLPPLNMSHNAWTQQVAFLRRHGYAPHIPIYPAISITGCMEGRSIPRRWSTRSSTTSGASSGRARADAGVVAGRLLFARRRREMAAAHLGDGAGQHRGSVRRRRLRQDHRPTPRTRSQCRLLDIVLKPGSNIATRWALARPWTCSSTTMACSPTLTWSTPCRASRAHADRPRPPRCRRW